jgi:polyhydroxyalkanoate synthesis regulator phasin
VSLPGLTDSLADNSRAVIKALAEGELTPEEAGTVLQALASQVRIIEADEIEKRLTALEQAAGKRDYSR